MMVQITTIKLLYTLSSSITTCLILTCFADNSTLKGVMILSRHGDRSPTAGYPNDPYKDYDWAGGYGSITSLGLQQMRHSGILKRMRYNSILQVNELYVRSSASERCIVSTESFLSGLLPKKWRNVHMNIPDPSEDEFLIIPGRHCPAHNRSFMESFNLNQTEVEEVLDGNEHVIDYIRQNTALNITNLIDILNVEDTLSVQSNNGFKMPAWAPPVYHTYIKPLAHIAYSKMSSSAWMQVKSGALLKDIVERLELCTIESNENIIFYSGHDLNLSALMMYLGVINRIEWRPDFSAAFVMELHKHRFLWQDYEVRFLYFRNEADEFPVKMSISSCGTLCSFKRFKKICKSKLVKDYDRACLAGS